jgi:hypothetical protein
LESLTHRVRELMLARRAAVKIPDRVAFVCVVCELPVNGSARLKIGGAELNVRFKRGDGVVNTLRQWSADLQEQGIPAIVVEHSHFTVMQSGSTAETLARLVREPLPRWNRDEVAAARKRILGSAKETDDEP